MHSQQSIGQCAKRIWRVEKQAGHSTHVRGDCEIWKEMVEKMEEAIRLAEEENGELRPKLSKTREEYAEIVAEIERPKEFVKRREELLKEIENSW